MGFPRFFYAGALGLKRFGGRLHGLELNQADGSILGSLYASDALVDYVGSMGRELAGECLDTVCFGAALGRESLVKQEAARLLLAAGLRQLPAEVVDLLRLHESVFDGLNAPLAEACRIEVCTHLDRVQLQLVLDIAPQHLSHFGADVLC